MTQTDAQSNPDDPQGGHGEHDLESLVHDGDVVMLTTFVGGAGGEARDRRLTSRPLTVAGVGGSTLLFLVDIEADWVGALGPADEVNASIATRRNDWVSVTGAATVTADDEAIAQLWSPAAGVYFDGPTDPRIRVLQLHMEVGEYWSAPGTGPLGRLVALVSAAIGGESNTGEHGRIEPTTARDGGVEDSDESMRRADAANGEPDASE